jgi:hypothetical protein
LVQLHIAHIESNFELFGGTNFDKNFTKDDFPTPVEPRQIIVIFSFGCGVA